MDITIKDVPEGAEGEVKNLAAVAVERFLSKPLQPPIQEVEAFKTAVDSFLISNEMPKKFDVAEPVEAQK